MKFIFLLTALALTTSVGPLANVAFAQHAQPNQVTVDTSASDQAQADQWAIQLGQQKKLLAYQKAALKAAKEERSNRVHLSRDFVHTAALAFTTGAISWDFYTRNNRLKDVFKLPPKPATPSAATVTAAAKKRAGKVADATAKETLAAQTDAGKVAATTEGAAKVAAAGEKTATVAESAFVRNFKPIAFRTTEAVSIAVLAVFLVGQVITDSQEISIALTDTDQIRDLTIKADEAERQVKTAEANLDLLASAQYAMPVSQQVR